MIEQKATLAARETGNSRSIRTPRITAAFSKRYAGAAAVL